MIAPCRCKGSTQNVHRKCLDHWRATNPSSRAFTHCEICNFEYVIEVCADEHAERVRQWKFKAFVARDSLLMFLAVQVAIVALGFLVRALDAQDKALWKLFSNADDLHHEKTVYYLCGLVLFLAIVGLCGVCHYACLDSNERNHCDGCCDGHNGGCWYISCNGNDCKCDGGGGGDGLAAVFVVLIILAVCSLQARSFHSLLSFLFSFFVCSVYSVAQVILAFIGLFVGIFFASVMFHKMVQKHARVLWLKEEAHKYRVVDFQGRPPPLPSCPSVGGTLLSVVFSLRWLHVSCLVLFGCLFRCSLSLSSSL